MDVIIKAPIIKLHNKGLFIRKSYYYQIIIIDAFKCTEFKGHLYLPNVKNIKQARLYALCFAFKCVQYEKCIKNNCSISEPINICINDRALAKEFKMCFILKYCNLSMFIRCNFNKYTPIVRDFKRLLQMFPATKLKPYWKATDITV